jgi:hypothetical protein
VLLAHLLSAAVWVGAPRQPELNLIAISGIGRGEAFNILHERGLRSALDAARTIPADSCKTMVLERFGTGTRRCSVKPALHS